MRNDDFNPIEPSSGIKLHLYDKYIKPLVRGTPDIQTMAFFLDQGMQAWMLGVKKDDIVNVKFVESLCEDLLKHNENELVTIIASILEEEYDAFSRLNESQKNLKQLENNSIETKLTTAIKHYGVYFESEFRLRATIPYYFICKIYKIKTEAKNVKAYIHVSAGEKFNKLKNITIMLPKGDIKDLIKGYDNEVRNAGGGHLSYEITDKDTILMNVVDPKSGELKGSKKIELTLAEIEKLLKQCEKTSWILQTGLLIFLTNNPKIFAKVKRDKPFKFREITEYMKQYAQERYFALKQFEIVNTYELSIILKYMPRISGVRGELLTSAGEKFDLIDIETEVVYENQILGIIQQALFLLKDKKVKKVKVILFGKDNKKIASVTYDEKEFSKILTKDKGYPIAFTGSLPKTKYSLIATRKVPYGRRDLFTKILENKGFKVKK